ncbi:MAG: hypothetical protein MRY64_12235 [Hyphomonadaceae bacterium]|nr:hypothetical protein [Hyphomonadaceae bacterium]
MRDRLFFPAIFLLAAALVWLALLPGVGALPSGPVSVGDGQYRQIEVSGLELNRIEAGGEVDIQLVRGEGPAYLRMETIAGALPDDPLRGPHFMLAADLEVQFSGFEMEITVRAKPGERLGATQMMVNYSTGRDGESGWETFDLRPDWEDFTFRYRVPVKTGENGLDYLAIRPVTPDKTRSLLIESIRFRRRGRWSSQEG